MKIHPRYLGDAVYATFDGYRIWLLTGSHDEHVATNRIALEAEVFEALVKYQRDVVVAVQAAAEPKGITDERHGR